MLKNPPLVELADTEMTVAGWLQSIADEFNSQESRRGTHDWFVREYGLMFEKFDDGPVGAPSLAEFLKALRNAPPAPKK